MFPTKLLILLILPLFNTGVKVEKGLFDFLFSPCKCRCGLPNREARFKGGEYLRGHEFPWLSAIQVLGEGEEDGSTIPGTLINNKYVVTAASQLDGITPYQIKVTLGQFDKCNSDISSTNVSVDKIIMHPDFSSENKANDIALIKLSTPILIERRVSPICLSVPGHSYLGQVATIAGWPKSEEEGAEEGQTTCRPKKIGLPVLSSQECIETAADTDSYTRDKGCVGVVGAPSVVCDDDGGNAVMYRSHRGIYELIGIMTDQNACEDDSTNTALYTRVNDHLAWIVQNTRDACYCIKT